MANPTTNYSFAMPTNTDLVKDLPADFEIFGQAVDTKIKDLNPETTAGDISYRGSTANAKTRLPIGTAGQLLKVNSGATAPEWATVATGGLTLISTTTLSGSSVTLSSIPSTYKHLQLIISGVTTNTASYNLRILPNNVNNLSGAGGARGYAAGSDTLGYMSNVILPTNNQSLSQTSADNVCQITIFNYASASYFKSFLTSYRFVGTDSNSYAGVTGGAFNSTTAITSLVIEVAGQSYSSGEVLFYGVS